jgi:uncharacterized membrane protein (DUF485 family)
MTQTPHDGDGASRSDQLPIDWQAASRSPEFRELVSTRRRFVVPATLFFMAWYFGFIALAGYAPGFMGEEFITDGLTVGYVLAITQFVMTFVLVWMYLRKADRTFDPLARKAAERARELSRAEGAQPRSRFERPAEQPVEQEEEVRRS